MNLKATLRSFLQGKPIGLTTRRHCRFQPRLEVLEDRLAPAVFTVNTTLEGDDGQPSNGTTTLREAVNLANVDTLSDTINFAAGLTNQTITLTSQLTITKAVTIAGLGSTKLTIDANNASRIFNINDGTAADIAVTISGLRLTRGNADGGAAILNSEALTLAASLLDRNTATVLNGGGIDNSGTVTLTNSTLSANSAAGFGGGIFNFGTVTLTNSTLSANSAASSSGGIYNQGALTLTNSALTGNTTVSIGGGIVNANSGILTVTNSTISANSASGNGGGIYNVNSTVKVTNSTISANSASGNGGGIYHDGGTLTMTNSTLSANSALDAGGIYINNGTSTVTNSTLSGNSGGGILNYGTLTLTNSTLSANISNGYGGGIYNDGMLTVTNSTLSNNSANYGGGISNLVGTVILMNSTLSGNAVSYSGGGIYSSSAITLINSTIVANRANTYGNSSQLGGGIYNGGTATLLNSIVAGNMLSAGITHNDISGTNVVGASAFNLSGDPNSSGGLTNGANGNIVGKNNGTEVLRLAEILDPTLRNNGGRTPTHALIRFSAAIDAGNYAQTAAMSFDQRGPGFNRIVNGQVDIGAFEMPRLFFTDDFQRANGPSLGPPWVNQAGALGIAAGLAQGTGTTTVHVATLAGFAAADLDLYATVILAVNQHAGLLARYSGAGDKNYYRASLTRDADGNVTARLARNVNGVVTELAVVEDAIPNVGASIFGFLRFRVAGSTLQLFHNNILLATVEDTTFKSGSVGMRSTGMAALDNFQAWPITTGVDNFDGFTQPDYTTLGEAWTQPVGFFRVLGNKLQGSQGLNLAVLNAANQPDVDVQASVNLGLNHTAGLLARYQGSGDANYYLANLTRTSTGFTASLLRKIGTTVTTLTTAAIPSSSGKAHLRFLVTGHNLKVFVNRVLVANFLETSLTTGSVGIRTGSYSTIDDFQAAAVTTDLPFADNFDQPSGSSLGINWTRRVGDFKVLGNKAMGANLSPAVNLATLVGVKQPNAEVQADVTLVTTGHEIGLLACQNGTTDANYCMARILKTSSGFTLSIVKNVSGTVTPLTATNVPALTGPIKFRLEGASLKLFMNNVLKLSTTDSSFTVGGVGIRSIGSGTIDNFSVTAINFLPYVDFFDADTLDVNWSIRAGGYTTTANVDRAKGTASLNLMTLRRFSAADVATGVEVNVPATTGQFASLFARYSGPADDNRYIASITYNGTQYVASIAKKVGGVTTPLASVNIGTGAGSMGFTAIGGQLKLFLDGAELLSVFDFTLKTGSVGIRSSLNPTFDDFSVDQAS